MSLDLEQLIRFEEGWDPLLGGLQTRVYREIAAYTIARLLSMGADLDSVLSYFREVVEKFHPQHRRGAAS